MADYGPASRFLHRLALGNYSVARLSLKMGVRRVPDDVDAAASRKVFVTGLARSGTTALTRHLAAIPGFCSSTYQDMPFPLMPNVWRPVNAGSDTPSLREREHGDGLLVDYGSVEAFEEFFWKVAADDAYLGSEKLGFDPVDDAKEALFIDYIACVLDASRAGSSHPASGAPSPVYLSKNNNQILRLSDLLDRLDEAFFVITIRDPLDHALSLLNQHRRFTRLQSEDEFVLDYMDWLGHHEFGLHAKWFDVGNNELNTRMADTNRDSVDHWLAAWLNYYSYLATLIDSQKLIVVSFARLCREPDAVIDALGDRIGFNREGSIEPFDPRGHEPPLDVDRDLLTECRAVFESTAIRSIPKRG